MKQKLLVTGASGFLGWNICKKAVSRYQVYGIGNRYTCDIDHVVQVRCDLTHDTELTQCFSEIRPDAVIHAAAQADPNYCQTHPAESAAINVTASVNIARQCATSGIPCIFTSTDLVFDGTKPPYKETAPVCPLNRYGAQKVEAEQGMRATGAAITVCRLPLMYGDAPSHAKSFIHPLVEAIKTGRALTLFTDEFRTPLSAADAAEGLLLALEQGVQGILHLGGPQRMSRYEIGQVLAHAMHLSIPIEPTLQKSMVMAAPRAADVSLDSTLAGKFGFHPRTMAQALSEIRLIMMF